MSKINCKYWNECKGKGLCNGFCLDNIPTKRKQKISWLITAAERIAAGEKEKDVMKDYGYHYYGTMFKNGTTGTQSMEGE